MVLIRAGEKLVLLFKCLFMTLQQTTMLRMKRVFWVKADVSLASVSIATKLILFLAMIGQFIKRAHLEVLKSEDIEDQLLSKKLVDIICFSPTR